MRIQQGEGWYLWEKSLRIRRQALRRTAVSVPRRDRLAGILVLLLTATGLLVTPTFGASCIERMASDVVKRLTECNSKSPYDRILECHKEAVRIYEKNLEQCMLKPETSGAIEEPPQAPVPVSCPDGHVPLPPCLLEKYIPLEFEEDDTPTPIVCAEGFIPFEFEEGEEIIQTCVGYPPDPNANCVTAYDEDSQKIVQICNAPELDSYAKKQAHFTAHHPLCKADDIIPWEVARRLCEIQAKEENQKRCAWRHPFYTSPLAQDVMQTWEMATMVELLACGATVVAPPMAHFCVTATAGWLGKKLVKWLAPKWPASKPICFELVEIEQACDAWAAEVVCTDPR